MFKQLSFIIFCFAMINTSAQSNNPKAQKAYDNAMLQLRDDLVKDAIPLLGKAIEYDPNFIEAYLSLAGVYGNLKDYPTAVKYYESAKTKDTVYFKYYLLPYSMDLAGMGRFEDALKAINSFLTISNLSDKSMKAGLYRRNSYSFAIDYAAKHPDKNYVFAPVNMGDSINSTHSEYYPSFTINDSIFVFTRHSEGIREDFMQSTLTPTGYTKAKLIEGDINAEPSKGAINISQDGQWLIFAGNFSGQGYGDFDLYISYNTPKGWSEPINLGPNINTEYWETAPSLSPDKNDLYFCSNRPGGFGGSDLYVSHMQPDGKWGVAQNMGPFINTAGDEQAPFIHADNQSLYFTSDGLPGYGGDDLYVVRKTPDGKWGKPENLGYPINTIENEGSLFVASDGVNAYYASDRADSRGELDLYKFQLPKYARPYKTLYVQGYVTDAITKKGLPCAVELTDDSTQQLITKLQTDESGFYFITLPVGKNYTFTVNRKGYLFYSDIFALQNKLPDSTYKKDIALQPVQLNASVVMKNIQFETNSFKLEPVSLIELDKLVQMMNDNASILVQISGHTDNIGNDGDNLKLSANRAKAVAEYLISKGIDAKRLTSKGFGASKPIAENTTEEGRAQNRRTEFTIVGM
jgi:outer membrane protein OmpA-like peptidoglycan-associated protein